MRAALVVAALWSVPTVAHAQNPAPIQDNSFLIEEAYNQEKRVVQHISAFSWSQSGSWWYTFTQEWPLFGQRSQLSYTIPLANDGFGDVALNYRLQLVGPGDVAFSPRVSLLLPTSSGGETALQFNLPLSARLAPRVVTHWNAGLTTGPTESYAMGASVIYEARHDFNVLVEVAWSRTLDTELFINPGIRWAHTLKSGLQIVPGIGIPLRVGDALPGASRMGIFLYLSLEHGF